MFGYKFKEWKWSQIRNVFYKKTLTAGTLILNTIDGEVKIPINRDGAEFWYARELSKLLQYTEYNKFEKVI